MKKITKVKLIPESSTILNGFPKVDYFDMYSVRKETDRSAEEISKELMKMPNWVIALMKLRNSIVKIFGLKTDKENKDQESFFTVIENNQNEIIMGEVDKHLDFRASIMKDMSENTISLITVVHYNNALGKVYFFFVKPFHKIIMKALLKRYLKKD